MSVAQEYWSLLNMFEDLLEGGYHRGREIPDIQLVSPSKAPSALDSVTSGEGAVPAQVMILGSWPSHEDLQAGKPFAGKAREFMEKWITAIGLNTLSDCYITNIIKNHSLGGNRTTPSGPVAGELLFEGLKILDEEIQKVNPCVILCLGEFPVTRLLESFSVLSELRGQVHSYKNIPVIVTWHPETALENYEELRGPVWQDLKLIRSVLDG